MENLVKIQNKGWVAVLPILLTVEHNDLSARDHYVQLLPSVPPYILLQRCLKPAFQRSLWVSNINIRSRADRLCINVEVRDLGLQVFYFRLLGIQLHRELQLLFQLLYVT